MGGLASYVLGQKIKILKEKIILRKRTEFGSLKKRKNQCLDKLHALDQRELSHSWLEANHQTRTKVLSDYNKLLRMEEISWRQKSKVA